MDDAAALDIVREFKILLARGADAYRTFNAGGVASYFAVPLDQELQGQIAEELFTIEEGLHARASRNCALLSARAMSARLGRGPPEPYCLRR
jgi:hypothetical protein